MFTAALFGTAPNWNTTQVHIQGSEVGSHSVEYYVTRNKDKLPVFVITWMKLTGVIASETSMKFQDRWN